MHGLPWNWPLIQICMLVLVTVWFDCMPHALIFLAGLQRRVESHEISVNEKAQDAFGFVPIPRIYTWSYCLWANGHD